MRGLSDPAAPILKKIQHNKYCHLLSVVYCEADDLALIKNSKAVEKVSALAYYEWNKSCKSKLKTISSWDFKFASNNPRKLNYY